jgi:hypothetical protein
MGSFLRFLGFLFRSWYSAILVGVPAVVSVLSYLRSDDEKEAAYVLVVLFLGCSTIGLLGASCTLYQERRSPFRQMSVKGIESCEEYGDKLVFVCEGPGQHRNGELLEVYRRRGSTLTCVAVLETKDSVGKGVFQAHPIWFPPVHRRALKERHFNEKELVVQTGLTRRIFERIRMEDRDAQPDRIY